MVTNVLLPELGENVSGGDVLRVLVAVGETVARDQPVLELETDKATIEVPSPVAGRVQDVRVKEGDRIKVGDLVLVVDEAEGGVEAGAGAPVRPAAVTVQRVHAVPTSAGEAPPIPIEDKPGMLEDALEEARAATPADVRRAPVVEFSRPRAAGEGSEPRTLAPAAPSVRRAARELGVDVSQVTGSGPGGRISVDDVKMHVKRIMSSGAPRPAAAPHVGAARAPLPDFSAWGQVERRPMRAVRRKTAEHLSAAWTEIPHVTQFDKADITSLEELRHRYADRAADVGGKLTVTAIAIKVVATALKVFPQFCASVDMAAEEIIYKHYVHVGVAVDTERGLLVPVIRDADRKSIVQISVELSQVSERARANKLSLDDMQGGTFTITNLGGIGGTHFTPIVNHPEVAILGVSRSRIEPVFIDGEFKPRQMLPLSLSYDHRVIDGADGIRFLRWVVEALEQPFLLSLEG
ncbi:MAG: aceF [Acidobacteria bacterium]|nr:aceF [Acidobacteriota bacterium]